MRRVDLPANNQIAIERKGLVRASERPSVTSIVRIEQLAMHPEAVSPLRHWFETEWPEYYGAGGPGDAQADLESFANRDRLPIGVVAFQDGELCGVAALKVASIASHRHLSPWAAAGLVKASERGKGIGARLIDAVERQARDLGFPCIYCGTHTANSLLECCGWELMERIVHEGHNLGIYRKAL